MPGCPKAGSLPTPPSPPRAAAPPHGRSKPRFGWRTYVKSPVKAETARHRKLPHRVRNNPRHVRFTDLVTLVEAFGFVLLRHDATSHRQYRHATAGARLNLQSRPDGKAKRYQVAQFLAVIDEFSLRLEDDER